jgi:hypothetical protein
VAHPIVGKGIAWAVGGLLVVGAIANAQSPATGGAPSTSQMNDANNPLTPSITLNAQDQWAPDLYGTDAGSNAVLLRTARPQKIGGLPQVLRITLPIVTAPSGTTGLGDLNLFDLFLFKEGHVELGVGPQLTIPTATSTETGTGKWQAGLAAVAIAPKKWGLAGALVTWQYSFAGPSDRPTQDNLNVQPVGIYNLPDGWYLRSSATWSFDLAQGVYVIPLGAGAGKVLLLKGGTTANIFAEPQFTVAHYGVGQPAFQVFGGINLQFPLKK